MDLEDVIKRVQKLIVMAESPVAPGATQEERNGALEEQQRARLLADKLISEYKLEQIEADKLRPAASRMMPSSILISLTPQRDLLEYANRLALQVAAHCSCKTRQYSNWSNEERCWQNKVYGFKPDLRYFEILYTTLRLHMVGALRPQINWSLTKEENAYILHNSGLNWFDIAKMYGWRGPVTPMPGEPKLMYVNDSTGERLGWSRAIKQYRIAYEMAVSEKGEDRLHVAPSGVKTFQINAADGYVSHIGQRLRAIRDSQPIGNALSVRLDEVEKLFRDENEDLFKPVAEKGKTRSVKIRQIPYNQTAYGVGVAQARTANLNPAAGGSTAKEIN